MLFEVSKERYILDPIYGIIYLPEFIWKFISCPELQRLREIRLCNINCLTLIGGSNINRYEHAIGTCYLAFECLKSWPALTSHLTIREKKIFLLAALFHDIVNGAFGHSFEYLEHAKGFNPEESFELVVKGNPDDENNRRYDYYDALLEPIFFGQPREILQRINEDQHLVENDVIEIGKNIAGKGIFGQLINSIIDLDNIDNVYRFAYHLGLIGKSNSPIDLAKSLYVFNGDQIIKKSAVPLAKEWHKLRKNLYLILLLNPEEFSGKCMLTEAIDISRLHNKNYTEKWKNVDFELMQILYNSKFIYETEVKKKPKKFQKSVIKIENKVFTSSNPIYSLKKAFSKLGIELSDKVKLIKKSDGWEIVQGFGESKYFVSKIDNMVFQLIKSDVSIRDIISRIMLGNLYGCLGIYSIKKTALYNSLFMNYKKKKEIDERISIFLADFDKTYFRTEPIAITHPIIDVNKTERKFKVKTEKNEVINVGNSSDQLLIGVFLKNKIYNMYNINNNIPKLEIIRKETKDYLSEILNDENIKEVTLYNEINQLEQIK